MRCVFFGTGGFLGRIDSETRCAFWVQEPVDHGSGVRFVRRRGLRCFQRPHRLLWLRRLSRTGWCRDARWRFRGWPVSAANFRRRWLRGTVSQPVRSGLHNRWLRRWDWPPQGDGGGAATRHGCNQKNPHGPGVAQPPLHLAGNLRPAWEARQVDSPGPLGARVTNRAVVRHCTGGL